jgi:hypothetical protein
MMMLLLAVLGSLALPAAGHANEYEDPTSPVVDQPSAFDVADIATQTSSGNVMTKCPEGLWTTGVCKYAQADILTSCTVLNSNGRCFERRVDKARLRGGTADYRSPAKSGTCKYAPPNTIQGRSGFGNWRLVHFSIVEYRPSGGVTKYSYGPGLLRTNCDVEYGPLILLPGTRLQYSGKAFFVFEHYCRSGEINCGNQITYMEFAIGVG